MMCGFEGVETCERNIRNFCCIAVGFCVPKVISKVYKGHIKETS